MKKIYGFAALCAAMTLASCSNDNEPNVVVDNGSLEPVYMNVKVNGASGTRASYNDANATDDETSVSSAQFILFNASGIAIGTSGEDTFTWTAGTTGSDITASSTQQVSFKKLPNEFPAHVMCILNGASGIKMTLGTTTLKTIREELRTAYNNGGKTGDDFIMTNSAVSGTNEVDRYLAPVAAYTDVADDANKLDPTEIYVERLAARIGYSTVSGYADNAKKSCLNGDEDPVEVKVQIQSIKLYNAATNSYLVKDIEGLTLTNDGHRTHWANKIASGATFSDKFSLTSCENSDGLTDAAATAPALIDYVFENVDPSNLTNVIVTGKLQIDGTDVSDDTPIYKLSDNKYYTTAGMHNYILNKLTLDGYNVVKDGQTKHISLSASNIDEENFVAGSHSYDGYAQIKILEGETLYKGTEEITAEKLAAENTALAADRNYRLYRYTNGLCYYYLPIQADDVDDAGIIRNHVYNIAINSIGGLGIPMFNPDEDLIPEDPEKLTPDEKPDYWLKCTINILNWKVYTQTGNFLTPNDDED